MSLSDDQKLFAQDTVKLFLYLYETNCQFTYGEAFRTKEQQKIYYETNKSKTLNSKHLERKAIDLNIWVDGVLTYKEEDLRHVGEYWKSLSTSNTWGGDWRFRDTNHFQRD